MSEHPAVGPSRSSQWEEASPALGTADEGVLSRAHVESWRERGLALVDGVLPQALLERARDHALKIFPKPGSAASEGLRDFGSGGRLQFPATNDAFNEITLHHRLLAAVAQLLDVGVRELRLTQSDLWPKYGREKPSKSRYDNDDQRIHCDYPNHTLLHPPRWNDPEAVEIILYLSDVDECGGPTAVVARTGSDDPAYRYPIVDTPGVGALEWMNDRSSAEAYLQENAPETASFRQDNLYPREVYTRYRFGTVLFYRHDTWHRGTPLRPGSLRLAQNLTFRKAASEWVSVLHPGWAWGMYRPGQQTERLVATCSVDQRCVLGFPEPGHPYWNRATVGAINARYGPLGFDVTPYERALARG
jgi:hypothetical protein